MATHNSCAISPAQERSTSGQSDRMRRLSRHRQSSHRRPIASRTRCSARCDATTASTNTAPRLRSELEASLARRRRPVGRQPDALHRRRGQSPRVEMVRLEAHPRSTRLHRGGVRLAGTKKDGHTWTRRRSPRLRLSPRSTIRRSKALRIAPHTQTGATLLDWIGRPTLSRSETGEALGGSLRHVLPPAWSNARCLGGTLGKVQCAG